MPIYQQCISNQIKERQGDLILRIMVWTKHLQ